MWEGLFSGIVESLGELLWHAIGSPLKGRRRVHPAIPLTCLVVLGGFSGFLMTLALPARMIAMNPVPGASLVLSPLVTGLLMQKYGEWLTRRGRSISMAATFWGGATFALGAAAVRFLLVS